MFEKGKRERRQSQDDKVFNRMLLWLAGAVVAELLFLLLQKAYVDMIFGPEAAQALYAFFRVYCVAGIILTAGGIAWMVVSRRNGNGLVLPLAVSGGAALLWVVALLCVCFSIEGVHILLMLPAAAAVLIIIFFLYQRAFFYNAILTGGGLLALWLYRQYYMDHPRFITACFVGGLVVLAAAAALAFQIRKNDGQLGPIRALPTASNYSMTWLTCGVTALLMVLALILGLSATQYLLYVLAAWLFAQAVFFTVKMM